MKMEGSDAICLTSVGDAASRQGEFFEAIAFAVQEKLPVIFVVGRQQVRDIDPNRQISYHSTWASCTPTSR